MIMGKHVSIAFTWQSTRMKSFVMKVAYDGVTNKFSFVRKVNKRNENKEIEKERKLKDEKIQEKKTSFKEMPKRLLLVEGIEYQINFIPRASLPNSLVYMANHKESKKNQT
ncbi:hypothetical protein CR513_19923, partial [Mucuna pruriens]